MNRAPSLSPRRPAPAGLLLRRRPAGWALLALLLLPAAEAAPRVGQHDGFTRLVFDLGSATPAAPQVGFVGGKFTVTLQATLKAEQGPLNVPGVTGYAVKGGQVTLGLAAGTGTPKVSLLPAAAGTPARLVIDVPKGAAGVPAAARAKAATVPAQPAAAKPAAPAPVVARPASTRSAVRPVIVLDAGHGGIDPGMVSRWVVEEVVTLDIALRTRAELIKHGVDVVMVRETDRHLSADKTADLDARARLATNDRVSAYISIHVNSASPAAQGIETYYFGQPLAGRSRSLAVQENGGSSVGEALTRRALNSAQGLLGDILAQAKLAFSRQLAQKVQSRLISATGAVNRGVQTDAFYVIRNPTTPAILVEVGFGSHPVEGPRLATPEYREKLAQGLARAILDFLNTK
ncbi:N-acetylmuramoyl-L-alanine amidase [Deinococcus ficus]|uniref:N-acetylmuramoyl-L-alanine amidase n=1 Tax=Deinococcus ficus TaxID=317577 RepID=UPI0019A661B0|nr:N-acetylmuramoyl-L-alanine amidase [Deinococcus ficus]GHF67993.1 N-acetylmuramoyl-L-alanine amidase [Deinococcus ficus]